MWRSKKLVVLAVLVASIILAGGLGGIALAQTGSTDTGVSGKTLTARVAAILGIDQQKVEDAFSQAQREMEQEAMDNFLNNLVKDGKITQEQANQYKSWWQSMPDMPAGFGFRGHGGFGGPGGPPGSDDPAKTQISATSQTRY
ncbi:MAG: hypothetical protein V1767_01310 [Chloroflexota bacterium]